MKPRHTKLLSSTAIALLLLTAMPGAGRAQTQQATQTTATPTQTTSVTDVFGQITSTVNEVTGQFGLFLDQINDIVQNISDLPDRLLQQYGELGSTIESAYAEAMGKLGLLDPNKLKVVINAKLSEDNKHGIGRDGILNAERIRTNNQDIREANRRQVDFVLGHQAQDQADGVRRQLEQSATTAQQRATADANMVATEADTARRANNVTLQSAQTAMNNSSGFAKAAGAANDEVQKATSTQDAVKGLAKVTSELAKVSDASVQVGAKTIDAMSTQSTQLAGISSQVSGVGQTLAGQSEQLAIIGVTTQQSLGVEAYQLKTLDEMLKKQDGARQAETIQRNAQVDEFSRVMQAGYRPFVSPPGSGQ